MANKKGVHVVPNPDGGWDVKRTGSKRARSHHETKKEADAKGRGTARREGVELIIHGKDGKIQDKDSFGKNPFPPRDKKH